VPFAAAILLIQTAFRAKRREYLDKPGITSVTNQLAAHNRFGATAAPFRVY